jgi:hypothetical protein
LSALFQSSRSPNADLRKSSYELFSQIPELFGSQLASHLPAISDLLYTGFNDPEVGVKVASLGALVCLFEVMTKELRKTFAGMGGELVKVRFYFALLCLFRDFSSGLFSFLSLLALFQFLLLPSLQVLRSCNDSTDLKTCLEYTIHLCEVFPVVVKPVLPDLLTHIFTLASTSGHESDIRSLAMEVVVTLADTGAPMIRKHPAAVQQAFAVAFQMLCEVEDDEEWYTTTAVRFFLQTKAASEVVLHILTTLFVRFRLDFLSPDRLVR